MAEKTGNPTTKFMLYNPGIKSNLFQSGHLDGPDRTWLDQNPTVYPSILVKIIVGSNHQVWNYLCSKLACCKPGQFQIKAFIFLWSALNPHSGNGIKRTSWRKCIHVARVALWLPSSPSSGTIRESSWFRHLTKTVGTAGPVSDSNGWKYLDGGGEGTT